MEENGTVIENIFLKNRIKTIGGKKQKTREPTHRKFKYCLKLSLDVILRPTKGLENEGLNILF